MSNTIAGGQPTEGRQAAGAVPAPAARGISWSNVGQTVISAPGHATTVLAPDQAIGSRPSPGAPGGIEVSRIYLNSKTGEQSRLPADSEEIQRLITAVQAVPPPANASPATKAEYKTTLNQLNTALKAQKAKEAEMFSASSGPASPDSAGFQASQLQFAEVPYAAT